MHLITDWKSEKILSFSKAFRLHDCIDKSIDILKNNLNIVYVSALRVRNDSSQM